MGENFPFSATAYDAAGNPCENVTFNWSSANPGFATIDANGIARGVAPGAAAIMVRVPVPGAAAKTATAALTVSAAVTNQSTANTSAIPGFNSVPGRPTGPGYAAFDREPDGNGPAIGLWVDPLQLPMVRGEWRTIDYHPLDAGGQPASRVPVIFSVESGGERFVSVDSLGIVTSVGDPGVAIVRLTVPGQTRIAPKQVRVEVRADTVRFNHTDFSMVPGAVETLSVFIPAQARALNNPDMFQFRSSDESKVQVNPVNPVVTARAAGTVRILAQSSVYPELSATIHVHPRVASVRLDPADTLRTIAIGGRTSVRATPQAEDGSAVTEVPMTWRSFDTTLIAFDSATGQVRGRRSGLATISVAVPTIGEQAITRMVHIRVVAGGLSVPRARFGMSVGEHRPIEVALLDDAHNGVGSANSYLTWSATSDTVVRIENGSEMVALRPGRVRLTGRATWDSTVSMDIFVVGDMMVTAQVQGHRDLIAKWNAGQNWAPLTNDSLTEIQSTWAPDLTRMLVTIRPVVPANQRNQPGVALWLMNADGTGRIRVTDDSATVRFPSFFPAGDRLLYESNKSGTPQVWTADVHGDTVLPGHMITTATPGAANTAPTVSRDGRRIAYISFRETPAGRRYGLYQANADGTGEALRTVAPNGQNLDNPVYGDAQTLYFLRSEAGRPPGKRVYKISVEGAATDSAVAVTPPGIFVSSFSISGDGTLLALGTQETVQGNQPPLQHVMLFNLANGQSQSIDTTPEERPASPTLRPATPSARPAAPPNR